MFTRCCCYCKLWFIFWELHNHGCQKIREPVLVHSYVSQFFVKITQLPIKQPVLYWFFHENCQLALSWKLPTGSFHKTVGSLWVLSWNLPILYCCFHGTHQFFEDFEIIKTNGFLLSIFFPKSQNKPFFINSNNHTMFTGLHFAACSNSSWNCWSIFKLLKHHAPTTNGWSASNTFKQVCSS